MYKEHYSEIEKEKIEVSSENEEIGPSYESELFKAIMEDGEYNEEETDETYEKFKNRKTPNPKKYKDNKNDLIENFNQEKPFIYK